MSEKVLVTREKHLDHMGRVIPMMTMFYAVHCYILLRFGTIPVSETYLPYLGIGLAAMVSGFIIYDINQKIELLDDHLTLTFKPFPVQTLKYDEINSVEISGAGQTFATLIIRTKNIGTIKFYFVDEAEKIKKIIDERRCPGIFESAA